MAELSREELAAAVKPHPYGDSHDHCLRCREETEMYENFELSFQDRGNARAGDPPISLGYLCSDCIAELLDEWGYELTDEATEW